MKDSCFIVLFVFLVVAIANVAPSKDWSGDKDPKKWLNDGKVNIKRILNRQFNGNVAKNVMYVAVFNF